MRTDPLHSTLPSIRTLLVAAAVVGCGFVVVPATAEPEGCGAASAVTATSGSTAASSAIVSSAVPAAALTPVLGATPAQTEASTPTPIALAVAEPPARQDPARDSLPPAERSRVLSFIILRGLQGGAFGAR